jgi:hypothetical protein
MFLLRQNDCEVGHISLAYALGVRASIGKHHLYAVAGGFLELNSGMSSRVRTEETDFRSGCINSGYDQGKARNCCNFYRG